MSSNKKLEEMEEEVLLNFNRKMETWYWDMADEWEGEGRSLNSLDNYLDSLEDKGYIKTAKVKGASNAEYYELTKKGKIMVEKLLDEPEAKSREFVDERIKEASLKA